MMNFKALKAKSSQNAIKPIQITKEEALKKIHDNFYYYENLPDDLKNDNEIITEMGIINGLSLRLIPYEKRNDKELILNIAKLSKVPELMLNCLDNELLDDKDFLVEFLKINGYSYRNLPYKYRFDKDLLQIAIKQNESILKYAPEEVKSNKELILSLFRLNPISPSLISENININLLKEKDFVLKIINYDPNVYDLLDDELKNDIDIIVKVCSRMPNFLSKIPEKYKTDLDLIKKILKKTKLYDLHFLDYVKEEVLANKNNAIELLKINGLVLNYLPLEFKNDKELVCIACKKDINSLKYASYELQNNKDFVIKLCNLDINAIRYASTSVIKELIKL